MTTQPTTPPVDPNDPTGRLQQLQKTVGQYTGTRPADQGNVNNPTDTGTVPSPVVQDPAVNTLPDGTQTIQLTVGGKPITITINQQVKLSDSVRVETKLSTAQLKRLGMAGPGERDTVESAIQAINGWYSNTTKRQQIIDQMFDAGLITTKKNPSVSQVAIAWALLVQEASLNPASQTPEDLLAKAATNGWNALQPKLNAGDEGIIASGNPRNAADASTTSSKTVYTSYLDPATIMGAQADAWYRLMGRNPTSAEYQAFMNSVFGYQDASNTGKFETKTTDPSDKVTYDPTTGQPVGPQGTSTSGFDPTVTTNTVSQRGIGTRGLQFLAGQAALTNPEEGPYQAATTYFNAFIKALSGPAAGMQASGPTTTVP